MSTVLDAKPIRCQRCGWRYYTHRDAPEPIKGAPYPALSYHEETPICSWCGNEETKILMAGAPEWSPEAWKGRPVPKTRRYHRRQAL